VKNPERIIACRGDEESLIERVAGGIVLLADIEVYGRFTADRPPPTRELKAGGGEDTNAHRLELIQALKDGRHLELVVKRARTYKQSAKPGSMINQRGVRFLTANLGEVAPSWKGQPFLLNHNVQEQEARKGTILTSELGEHAGSPAIFMGFSVVKTDAAISVLDGTIDRFSVAWRPKGPVFCTVHGVDLLGKESCMCWPLEQIAVDGKQRTVEYEYHGGQGKELSAVNVPAVDGTRIEEYRAALAAELDLPPTRKKKERTMAFERLRVILGMTTLSEADEGQAVALVEALRTRATTAEQERDTARTELAALNTQLSAARAGLAVASKARLDALISGAIRDGKIKITRDPKTGDKIVSARETRLRKIGAEPNGLAAVEAEIAELDVIVPVGKRPIAEGTEEPTKQPIAALGAGDDEQLNAAMEDIARDLGLDIKDMIEFQQNHYHEGV